VVQLSAYAKSDEEGQMTEQEAIEVLGFHCGVDERIDDPRWVNGFLGTLRPYRGLLERNFHEVMAALATLAERLHANDVPRAALSSLIGICHLGRAWGVHPDGMLRRNNLISPDDVTRLERWIETISYATMMVLDGYSASDKRELGYEPPPEWSHIWDAAAKKE
jgi:hypothetical protein